MSRAVVDAASGGLGGAVEVGREHRQVCDIPPISVRVTEHQLIEDTLTRYRRVLGEDHPATLHSASHLAADLSAVGEHERARQLEDWIRGQRGS